MVDYLFVPKNFLQKELKKVGVGIVDRIERSCICILCEEKWNVPKPIKGNKLPKDFWKCPSGCNTLSLQIRSIGPGWVLWELPDGTPFVGNFDEDGKVELSELQPVKGKLYDKLKDHLEEDCDTLGFGLDWEIYEYTDGSVFVADLEGSDIYTLKPASEKIKKIYQRGKENQYQNAGDLGMHT